MNGLMMVWGEVSAETTFYFEPFKNSDYFMMLMPNYPEWQTDVKSGDFVPFNKHPDHADCKRNYNFPRRYFGIGYYR